ncbi:anti-sigma regulatory factor [Chryseolinea lacunae]|uniref:Anti-sigma regulatory factor n=1 Tax=Chryseolinea lacunae TaxID=2801331 RepID=A0ABS1L5Q0_9BACT|nr:anti-sigma regulatory factor [Chryseolinea lacunae]MBL0745851.1 anti-sigma regulatory factor [Chryseolinea lacunae]
MMVTLNKESMTVVREIDVIPFRNRIKETAAKMGMGLVNQTKLITAASELARNMLKYAKGGKVLIEVISKGRENGIRLVFKDEGPGIPDIALAMKDGYSTGKSLGLGLPGTRRLVSEFNIETEIGKGTTVTIIKWKNG